MNFFSAITFVALGTSLPDTFASKTAAANEKNADNAIGNVTGSNSVNVFLGLGLPWVIASIYHWAKVFFIKNDFLANKTCYRPSTECDFGQPPQGNPFVVQSGTLGFSVGIYTCLAFVGISILMIRRMSVTCGKAELGGPSVTKYLSSFLLIFLWMVYIVLSSLEAYGHIKLNF